ncbi:MAG TPA: 5-oxoprolinase subunit PxpB [Chitinophagaceae bacterium]|jgi:inhibitor of KinA
MPVRILPLGDHAITVAFGDTIDEDINQQAISFFDCLKQRKITGVKDIIPAYTSVTVVYDIMAIHNHDNTISALNYMHHEIEKALQHIHKYKPETGKTVQIPVCYDISLGIDLKEMAEQKSLSVEEIIRLHSSVTYRVYMIGFMPGFPYMGKVNNKIATPRKNIPRKNVVAGSVGIADFQTGIYPFDSPGGWNIIGQTPMMMFNTQYTETCLLKPGDKVNFVPISLQEFKQLKP